ncbi:hypothetical protein niasHT_009112 [Heterodera trifolii]|uniref:Uncharacterized protein n=1 Tax=Heterodera trifolii TaxID=157864 RepID=A0ABD2M3Y6_9BILA
MRFQLSVLFFVIQFYLRLSPCICDLEDEDDCINAIRYRDFTPPPELVEFVYANVRPESQGAAKKADIVKNTYKEDCLPENGNDIFRVNVCVQDNYKCPQKFHDICNAKGGEGKCEFCSKLVDNKVCNSLPEKINLDQSHPVPEPTKLTIVIEPQVISGVGVTKTTVFSSPFYIIVFGAMAAYFMALIR